MAVLALPAMSAAGPALAAVSGTIRELRAALKFRAEWRWRVPATHRLAAAFSGADHARLGYIAGQLQRTQAGNAVPGDLADPGYGLVCAGTVITMTEQGQRVVLTAGGTWGPLARLTGCGQATVVHISADVVDEILARALDQASLEGQAGQVGAPPATRLVPDPV